MSEHFEILHSAEVISVQETDQIVVSHTTFKVSEFTRALKQSYLYSDAASRWLGKGVSCEVLSPTKGWRKGKIKISLTFCPDEPESPLDDIRHQINNG